MDSNAPQASMPGFSSRSGARNSAISQPAPFDMEEMKRSVYDTDSYHLNVSSANDNYNQNSTVHSSGTPTSPFMNHSPSFNNGSHSPSFNTQQSQFPSQNQQSIGLGMQLPAGSNIQMPTSSPYSPMLTGFGGFNPQSMNNILSPSQQMLATGMASPNLNAGFIPMMTPMSPNFAIGGMSPMMGSHPVQGRTIYVGGLPAEYNIDELLDLVKYGPLESVRVLAEKNCVFLSFLDVPTASAFFNDAQLRRLNLNGTQLRVGWGKQTPIPTNVQVAIVQNSACRNVYLGNIDENMTGDFIRADLERFGPIDQVKILREKGIAFVHFLSIAVAMKVVATLPSEPTWANARINYGKDRCAFNRANASHGAGHANASSTQSPRTAQFSGNSPISPSFMSPTFSPNMEGFSSPSFGNPMSPMLAAMAGQGIDQELTRTVYIGNLSEDTRVDELCNAIRGGLLQSVKFMQDKHIAFVTFVELASALFFVQFASSQGVTIKNRRLKIGWGKNSGPLPRDISQAVQEGATRNIYLGQITDPALFSEDRLRDDFSVYGEIELINSLREKNCAWVNFCNISSAIKALDPFKVNAEYMDAGIKIAYGKDRCANAPRVVAHGHRSGHHEPSSAMRTNFPEGSDNHGQNKAQTADTQEQNHGSAE